MASASSSVVDTYQVPWELDHLLNVYDRHAPEFVLEVGSMFGGTLYQWMNRPSTKKVVAVDDEMRNSSEWHEWAYQAGVGLITIRGMSQDYEVIARAAENGPYDFVFIDADHRYESVRADWHNYSNMVVPGGAIAFHDILPRFGYGVSDVWAEVKADASRWVEIGQREVHPGNEGTCGIGVAWL